jgi:arabinofuranan 3-O-arabinosyltransferase
MLWSQPGVVTDDTKTYLYLDPGRYLRQAASLWNPNVALGTVTHENIGYLLPMGPFFWLMAELHVPLWVAQRFWIGGLLFGAGAGMLYLTRTIGLSGPGRYVASFAFMFTPYLLQYTGRISVILMPWAGLPWMTAFVVKAMRRGGWRDPALFALVVALVSGINASSILYAGIGPVLWLPFAVLVLGEGTWRRAWSVTWRVALLTAFVCLWWAVGLQVEAAYGVNILKYTETLTSTSSSSSPFEILRGLGYWFFYGASDQTGSWTQAAVSYTQDLWLIAFSFLVPTLAFTSAALIRWRQRAYFVVLVVVGTVLAVGPYPYSTPSAVSALFKAFMGDTTAGLALRSTDRASPLLLLGLATLLGAGVTAVYRRATRTGVVIGLLAAAAVAGATVPLWTGATVVDQNVQPASPPDYVKEAAAHLNATHPGTRVYGLPGSGFAAYRWGDTNDTVWPGLLTRPFVTHEQQTMGSLPTADLLEAVDAPLQEGTMDPATLAPMAALMSAGDVLVQYDQAYERFDTPNPQQLALDLTPTPPGLSDPVSYGTPRPNVSTVPHFDEQALSRPANQGWTAPLVSYTVHDPRPVVRAEPLTSPLVVSGNGAGLVAASSVGLLSDNPTIFYSGTLDTQAALRRQTLSRPADLVVTDSNRKQGYRWNGISENAGYTQTSAQGPDKSDPFNAPLDLFPKAPADAFSTTVFRGITSVTASSYGSPVQYFVDQRPAAAVDGNVHTAWLTSQGPMGQWWQVTLSSPVTTGAINLVQQVTAQPRDVITKVDLSFGEGRSVAVPLGPASRTPAGQTVRFPERTFSELRITILDSVKTKYHVRAGNQNYAGFAEVRIPGVTADETVSMPQDLLRASGTRSLTDPLTLVMTRQRSSGFPPRSDAETNLSRAFWLPTARTFSLVGQARISPLAADATVDEVVGRTTGGPSGVTMTSSNRLTGDVTAGATAAIDGDPSTAWEPGFGAASGPGQWVQYQLARPLTFDALTLRVVADGQHSVPTAVRVSAGGSSVRLALPPIASSRVQGSTVEVPLTLPTPLTGQTVRVTVDGVRPLTTVDYYSQVPTELPIGIAEVGIPGLAARSLPTELPASCRDDLLTVDGRPVWLSVRGAPAAALDRQPLTVSLCGPDGAGLVLAAGDHTLRSAPGSEVGFDLDQLALGSAAGGGPAPTSPGGQLPTGQTTAAPSVRVLSQSSTSMQLRVSGVAPATGPFELVLGQSVNAGWQATVGGRDLGAPVLVDGFANGWRVDPGVLAAAIHGGSMDVSLRWTPQGRVDAALVISGAAIVACLVIVVISWRRRRRADVDRQDDVAWPDDPTGGNGAADDVEPVLTGPVGGAGRPLPVPTSLWVAVGCGVGAGLIAAPFTGVVVGVAAFLTLRSPRMKWLLVLAAVACIAAAGTFVTLHQAIAPTRAYGGWPVGFGTASSLAWAGVLFLGADAVCELTARIRRRRGGAVPAGSAEP